MDYVYYIYNNVKYFYNSMNSATLSGAIDVIVVEQPDGSLASTPFHVRFGKYGVFNYENKYVDIEINGEEIDLKMKLGENGVAFFLANDEEEIGETKNAEGKEFLRESQNKKWSEDTQQNNHPSAIDLENQLKCSFASSSSSTSSCTSQPQHNECPPTTTTAERKQSTPPKRSKMVNPSFLNHKASVQQNRQRLPFSSSIYSCRRNRSLPDLANLLSPSSNIYDSETVAEEEGMERRKGTMSSRMDELRKSDGTTGANNALKHSNSASVPLKSYYKHDSAKTIQFSSPDSDKGRAEAEKGKRAEDDESKSCAPSTSELADGALSDSEVDRHGSIKDPEWKWGEIPKSNGKGSNKADGSASRKKSRWDYWFGRWSRQNKEKETEGRSGGGENGLSLEDIGNNPVKFGLYIGPSKTEAICISSKSSDSGNGPSLGTSPTMSFSPVLSEENLASEFAKGNVTIADRRPSNAMDFEMFEEKAKEKRSLRLSRDQLDLLNLNYGSNDARFSITTKYQGTAWCSCHIYLLKWYDKLVISDIDGTITKSDVLGHVIPAIGGTWAHSGVAELYTGIKKNGYQMVYLSSRAIGQSHYTKTYLQNFAQGSRTLPDGPVLLSPSSVLMAFRKEVIERKPEEFKIACLTDLKSLFPIGQPFFAGFGNRETDVKSYLAVQIPPERIMIIDPQGSLRRADNKAGGYVSDYPTLAMDSVDYVFPPRVDMDGIDIRTKEDGILSEFIAWRTDAEQFDALVDAELEQYEERSKRAKAIVAGTMDGRGADGKKKMYRNGRRAK
ncbi:hypothetical protein niasHT_016893 [Heterodera trifolii]|uniref:LNS2/PITP domain-containing protein n=1 Tax=Heterodera trifolii TaxID=157864 RepID=A0ABD2KTH3_9BILA